MEVQIAVAKIKKYATSSSGDTVEVVERPQGGVSVVLADGQSSGLGAKWISNLVVRKVIALLAEGVRDGAAARAASDSLYTERRGKVSSTLNIISIDQQTQTMVITRNNPAPALMVQDEAIKCLDDQSKPVGLYRGTRPNITELPVIPGMTAIIYSDGLVHAGKRGGINMDVEESIQFIISEETPPAEIIADVLLEKAVGLDEGRPVDDISIVVVRILEHTGDKVRRMSVRLPLGYGK
jgi:serine phosphatase RsbU (regulator of sigma subunit)